MSAPFDFKMTEEDIGVLQSAVENNRAAPEGEEQRARWLDARWRIAEKLEAIARRAEATRRAAAERPVEPNWQLYATVGGKYEERAAGVIASSRDPAATTTGTRWQHRPINPSDPFHNDNPWQEGRAPQ